MLSLIDALPRLPRSIDPNDLFRSEKSIYEATYEDLKNITSDHSAYELAAREWSSAHFEIQEWDHAGMSAYAHAEKLLVMAGVEVRFKMTRSAYGNLGAFVTLNARDIPQRINDLPAFANEDAYKFVDADPGKLPAEDVAAFSAFIKNEGINWVAGNRPSLT